MEDEVPVVGRQAAWFGLVRRRECWTLSLRGWLLLVVVIAGGGLAILRGIHPFLAVQDRIDADYLVVEGWIPKYALPLAVREFTNGGYKGIITTGVPLWEDARLADRAKYASYAEVAAVRLAGLGVPTNLISIAAATNTRVDRTYGSAVAVRSILRTQGASNAAVNVFTEEAHARRSRLLFARGLGAEVRVGVVPFKNEHYDSARWWASSEGAKTVIEETVAYLYARLGFQSGE